MFGAGSPPRHQLVRITEDPEDEHKAEWECSCGQIKTAVRHVDRNGKPMGKLVAGEIAANRFFQHRRLAARWDAIKS